jgi:transcriptional regulator with XRE-family HTH domain
LLACAQSECRVSGSRKVSWFQRKTADIAREPQGRELMSKSSNIVDVYVGARLRMRRTMLGMSQSKLGQLLGVTFQQIQKYEKGSNRISASRLQRTARVLEVSPGYFFEGAPAQSAEPGFAEESSQSYVVDFLASTEGLQLNRAFLRVRDPKVRRRIVDLVISLASGDDEEGGGSAVR